MNLYKIAVGQHQDPPEVIQQIVGRLKEIVNQKIVLPDSLNFEFEIKEISALSNEVKVELFSKELDALKKDNKKLFIDKIIFISYSILFFPDDEIFTRFKELGFPDRMMKWFVSIQKIKAEFDLINQSESIKVIPTKWMYFIHQHLFMNFLNEIYIWAGLVAKKRSGKYYNDLHNTYFDLFRTKGYYSKINKKFEGNNLELQLVPILDEISGDAKTGKEVNKEFLQSFQGKTEKSVLAFAFNECSFQFANGQRPYIDTWNLFKLLLPNRNLMSEKTFMESDQFETYERNYNRYRYYTLKKIIPTTDNYSK